MKKVYELYAVVENPGEGLWYETLDDTPAKAIASMRDLDDVHKARAQMMAGTLAVHRVRVEVLEKVDPTAKAKGK